MSVGICGYINFQSDSLSDKVDLSFHITQQAIKSRLGCKLGGNISEDAFSILETILENDITDSTILIEIMDTPLDNYANDMCQPSINIIEDPNLDISDKIKLNLCCLQEFLLSIINYKNVNKIMLYFNYVFNQEDDKTIETSIDNFTNVMHNYYDENDYFAPELKIIISRD